MLRITLPVLVLLLSWVDLSLQKGRCGRRTNDEDRIYYGRAAKRGSHPWLVSLEHTEDGGKTWEHRCGGTIVKKNWVVTAAHCFINFDTFELDDTTDRWRVVGGEHDKSVHEASEQIVKPSNILLHPGFDHESESYSSGDLALMKLEQPLRTQTPFSRQVCRPPAGMVFSASTHCQVAGWGSVNGKSLTPDSDSVLQYYNSTIVSQAECRQKAEEFGEKVADDMICLRTEYDRTLRRSGGGACRGDSGGALVCQMGEKFYLAGVVSWNMMITCGREHDVFTRYQSYAAWVNNIIKSN